MDTTRYATAACLGLLLASPVRAQLPVSLDHVPVPEPKNLARFVKDRAAAVRLGKALFWDMQLGSDGITACATCHFHAGADSRARNTLSPGPGGAFQVKGRANADLLREDYPFHRFLEPDDRFSPVTRTSDDVAGSQGVTRSQFHGATEGAALERGRALRGGTFGKEGRNVRQVTGRNAPSVINAVFNIANFWDGRAHHFFNGVNPFGIMDVQARVLVNQGGALAPLSLTGDLATNPYALDNASLASQAVGPPLSDVEMSSTGRGWRDIGRKLLALKPLGKQRVHPRDGVLGALAEPGAGLRTTYPELVRLAFQEEFWNGPQADGGFTHMEANFALFFGLAIQLYEATLVSDDTPFDRFVKGDTGALTAGQLRGMNLFFSGGTQCSFCHAGPEFTAATIRQTTTPGEPGMIEIMPVADGGLANYDIGFYNVGVRPSAEDPGRGGRVTLNGADMPLSFAGQYYERATLPFSPMAQPGCVNNFLSDPPVLCPPLQDSVTRLATNGAFKVPGLRNVELTGPYMHNGGMATLLQVVEFYVRGGDFHEANLGDLDPIVAGIGGMQGDEAKQRDLVAFLLSLTDERVRWEKAPFDHPQLLLPDGHEHRIGGNPKRIRALPDRLREIPAVGSGGRQVQGLPPVKPFLAGELEGQALADFHFQP